MVTVWLFFILSMAPFGHHQAVEFSSRDVCEQFKADLIRMIGLGLSPGSRVTDCVPRTIVTVKAP